MGSETCKRWCAVVLGVALAAPSVALALDVRIAPRESPATEQDPAFRVFGTADGLVHSRVYALAQDRDGVVWAGTEAGLLRYDARRWEPVALPGTADGPPPYVNALAATPDGALWVATDELGVFRHADGRFDAPGGDALPSPYVQALVPASGDAVWVGTGDGVARCDARACRIVGATRGLAVYTLLEHDGVLWAGTIEDGLERFEPAGLDARATGRIGRDDGLPADAIRALAVFAGDLWIGTGFGFARLGGGGALTVYDARAGLETASAVAFQPSRAADGTPVLHVALQRGGLASVRPDGSWSRLGLRQGLPDEHVNALLETDHERSVPRLWLGTKASGVVRRDGGRFAAITTANGLPGRNIMGVGRAAFPDGVDAPWVGSVGGSARRVAGGWVPFGPPPLDRSEVYDTVADADGSLWIAASSGLVHWTRDAIVVHDRSALGTAGNSVLAARPLVEPDGTRAVWFGTRAGAGRLVGGRAQPLPRGAPAWIAMRVVRVFVPVGGDVWVAGEEGVARYRRDGWHPLPAACLGHREVFDLRLRPGTDAAPELWAATRAGLTRISTVPELRCDSVGAERLAGGVQYQVQFDARGRVYLFGYQGVTRLTPDPAAPHSLERAAIEQFAERDGLPAREFNRASFVDAEGRVWGGTTGGVALFDPASEPLPQAAKPLRVAAERFDAGSARPLRAADALPADGATVAFDYTLLSYEREHLNRYRVQLVGLDGAPGDWTEATSARYERLPPGAYTFRVWGRDAFGTESAPYDVAFRVGTPRWQSPWALVAYAALLLLVGNGLGRWRQRALAARARSLEHEVAQRTRDLEEANRQLERASVTDPLTGLPNRRHFAASLAAELDALRGKPARVVIGLLDLDHFKSINDRHGHATGDTVLQRVGTALAASVGPGGAALRWGGEEFLVVLPLGSEPPDVRVAALLDAVRACRVDVDAGTLPVTASLGWLVWPWGGTERVALSHVLTVADHALYQAKHGGRDRAVGAFPDAAAPALAEPPHLHVRWIG